MNKFHKPVENLQQADLEAFPVWQYANDDALGETVVFPVEQRPVQNLANRLVTCPLRLANGTYVWGLLGNVVADNPGLTEHFLSLSVLKGSKWFTLARYHDFNYSEFGPEALANFLGLRTGDVFPTNYDITAYVIGDAAALAGCVYQEPRKRLTRAEIIALAVP
jgi:hypothetical protein